MVWDASQGSYWRHFGWLLKFLVKWNMYHFSSDKYVPLQSGQVCTTSVQKSMYHFSPEECTFSVQTSMYHFSSDENVPLRSIQITSVLKSMCHFSPDKYVPLQSGQVCTLRSRQVCITSIQKVCYTSVQKSMYHLSPDSCAKALAFGF